MKRRRHLAAALLATALASATLACSSTGEAEAEGAAPREPTPEEASRLASVLANNFERQGAAIRVITELEGSRVTLSGTVDWANQRLAASVETGDRRFEIVTDGSTVAERFPGLADALEAAGFPGAEWVSRPFDSENGLVDRMAELAVGLSSENRDNPVLVREDSQYLRSDEVDGEPVDIFSYGERSELWVTNDAALVRYVGDVDPGAPIVIDLGEATTTDVDMPEPSVPAGQVPEIYEQFTR